MAHCHEIRFTRGTDNFVVIQEGLGPEASFVGYRNGQEIVRADLKEWACRALILHPKPVVEQREEAA